MKLSKTQRRMLAAIVEAFDKRNAEELARWQAPLRRMSLDDFTDGQRRRTLLSLERLGLVEVEHKRRHAERYVAPLFGRTGHVDRWSYVSSSGRPTALGRIAASRPRTWRQLVEKAQALGLRHHGEPGTYEGISTGPRGVGVRREPDGSILRTDVRLDLVSSLTVEQAAEVLGLA